MFLITIVRKQFTEKCFDEQGVHEYGSILVRWYRFQPRTHRTTRCRTPHLCCLASWKQTHRSERADLWDQNRPPCSVSVFIATKRGIIWGEKHMYVHLLPVTPAGPWTLLDGVSSRRGLILKRAAICLSVLWVFLGTRRCRLCRGVAPSSTRRDKRVSEEKKTTTARPTKPHRDQRGSRDRSSAPQSSDKYHENNPTHWNMTFTCKR